MGTMNGLEGSANNFNARLVIGPVQVGGLLSAALFGCLACQSYLYFARFASDHLSIKAIVSQSIVRCIVDVINCFIRLGICSHVRSIHNLSFNY